MAVLTVCSSGCDYTTLAAAIAAAGATDEIDIQEDITESIYLNKNIARIFSSNDSEWESTNNSALLQIGTGLTQLLKIEDIHLHKTSGNDHCVVAFGFGTGGKIEFNRCVVHNHSASANKNCLRFDATSYSNGDIKVDRCWIYRDGVSGTGRAVYLGSTSNAGALQITNSIITGTASGYGAIFHGVDTTNIVVISHNNTIVGNGEGMEISSTSNTKNCIFANNTDDISLGGSAAVGDFTYCAFEQADEALGSTNLCSNQGTAITSTDEFEDEGTEDYHLKTGADCINAGTNTGLSEDYDGNPRPQGSAYDIGAYEYLQANARTFIVSIV